MSSATVLVIGIDDTGSRCVETVLGHGADPRGLLAEAGWGVDGLMGIDRPAADIELTYRVRRAEGRAHRETATVVEVSPEEAETAVRRQRVAAYGIVTSPRGLLMTELSDKTARPGIWGLPGGGLDPGEHPETALRREIWEETGQEPTVDGPLQAVTAHWVGRAPNRTVEDFHAVRLIYRAHCSDPTDPVVHDVGGTTRSAVWCRRSGLGQLDVTPWARALIAENDG